MMMRYCPNCESERPVTELLCEGEFDGAACGWDLSGLQVRPVGWRPGPVPIVASRAPARVCENGHAVDAGDLICPECGADIGVAEAPPVGTLGAAGSADGSSGPDPIHDVALAPEGWRIIGRLPPAGRVRESFVAERIADGRKGMLSLYAAGSDPDPEVYQALRTISIGHVPEILEPTFPKWPAA